MLRFIENYDALLSPVMPYPALLHGTGFDDDKRIGFGYAQMHNLPAADGEDELAPRRRPADWRPGGCPPWREDVAWRWLRISSRPSAAGGCLHRFETRRCTLVPRARRFEFLPI